MTKIISCGAPYGQGGLGQHFTQLVEEARESGELVCYYTKAPQQNDEYGRSISLHPFGWIRRFTPVRFSKGWTSYLEAEIFDRRVAARLEEPFDRFMGFVGSSLRSFRRASELGVERLELVAANSHVNNIQRLHRKAYDQTGIKDTWLNEAQRRKTVKEYEMADVIHVHSDYVRDSFIAEGISSSKLRRTVLHVDERFKPVAAPRPDDDIFRVVYVGRVDATKGVPLLMEAYSRLSTEKKRLRLVGGWSSRGMRKYMEEWLERDSRIQCEPGDPLPVLHEADVFVHPTYEDGFGYGPMEAVACGVPVIVTEDTGMKEYIREGENGFVVPTGSVDALVDKMTTIQRRVLAG